jgi:hypothetical protein
MCSCRRTDLVAAVQQVGNVGCSGKRKKHCQQAGALGAANRWHPPGAAQATPQPTAQHGQAVPVPAAGAQDQQQLQAQLQQQQQSAASHVCPSTGGGGVVLMAGPWSCSLLAPVCCWGGGGGGLRCCDWQQRNHVVVSGASGGCRLVAGSADGLLLCCTSCAAACVGRLVAGPHEATSVCKYTTHVEWDAYMAVSTTPGSQACPHRQVGSMRSRQRHSRKSCNGAFCRAMYIVD